MLVSTGERVTMALLSIAIHARGVDAISFTGSQSGIITNDRHFDARILEVRPHRIEDELARGEVVIVAGYQGMSYRREITTLGRGGTDTTAVALAAALGAERCEIYSDVDGVYSADPRVVPDASHLPEIDLATLQEMAEAGAKVLNAQAVEWARRAGIAIHARRTADAPGTGRETVCVEAPEPKHVRAVVGLDSVVHARMPAGELRTFAEAAARARRSAARRFGRRRGGDLRHPARERAGLGCDAADGSTGVRGVVLEPDCAIVSVVGDGLTIGARALPRFLSCSPIGEVKHRAVHAGPLRISATIESPSLAAAQRALHAAFVGS